MGVENGSRATRLCSTDRKQYNCCTDWEGGVWIHSSEILSGQPTERGCALEVCEALQPVFRISFTHLRFLFEQGCFAEAVAKPLNVHTTQALLTRGLYIEPLTEVQLHYHGVIFIRRVYYGCYAVGCRESCLFENLTDHIFKGARSTMIDAHPTSLWTTLLLLFHRS